MSSPTNLSVLDVNPVTEAKQKHMSHWKVDEEDLSELPDKSMMHSRCQKRALKGR